MAFMNMKMEYDLFTTPIPNAFIDEVLPVSNPAYAAVYIFAFRHCFHGNKSMTTAEIAVKLNLIETDVLNAFKYFEKSGLVKLNFDKENNLNIEFTQTHPKRSPSLSAPKPAAKPIVLEKKPAYLVEEIDTYLSKSEEIRHLFSHAQKCLSKQLQFNDMQTLFSFYDWLQLPLDVIDYLIEYCVFDLDKRSLRYIETVAMDWADQQIATVGQAKDHTAKMTAYRGIMKVFGSGTAEPSPSQLKYIKKWLSEYNMPLDLIKLAADKTIMQLGKPTFPYADSILSDWFKNKLTTIEAVDAKEADFHEKKAKDASQTAPARGEKKPSKSKFVNFEQTDWDFDKLKLLEEVYIEEKLKG